MAGLATIRQEDFSAGMVRSMARHLIPGSALYDLRNLLLDDDGSAYRRGGSAYKSNAAFGTGGLRLLWDGHLIGGQRTVFANSADFGVLDADDASNVNLGGAGLTLPTGTTVIGGVLHVGGGVTYGGSRKAADYSTGTVTATQGSATLTGSGTAWRANTDAGMLLRVAGGQLYAVASVDSDTQITLDRVFAEATARGAAYTLKRLDAAAVAAPIYVAAGDRLVACVGNVVKFSAGRDPNTGELQYNTFGTGATADEMELPDGVSILGAQMVRDLLLIFSTAGLWAITNAALDLTDDFGNPQRRLDRVNGDIVLWGQAGIASWANALVVPTLDGVVLVDGVSPPTPVALSITPLIARYIEGGAQPGGAYVAKNHYFLPILDANGVVLDQLVCRLDRPARSRIGAIFPWARLAGHGGSVTALAVRVGDAAAAREPELLGAGADGRVLELSGFFSPSAALKADADGTVHEILLEGRDFETGVGNLNTVTRFRVRYELVDAARDDPMLTARYSIGSAAPGTPYWGSVDWGEFDWSSLDLADFVTFGTVAPENSGRDPFVWLLAARTRFIRPRLESADPAAKLVIRSLEWAIRQSARDR